MFIDELAGELGLDIERLLRILLDFGLSVEDKNSQIDDVLLGDIRIKVAGTLRQHREASYLCRVLENLDNFRNIALFHPRMALVGIASEVEIAVKEIFPRKLSQMSFRRLKRDSTEERIEISMSRAAWNMFESLWAEEFISDDVKSSPLILLRDYGREARHERVKVRYETFDRILQATTWFFDDLLSANYSHQSSLECPKCGRSFDYEFRLNAILNGFPGDSITAYCPDDGGMAWSYQVPDPAERTVPPLTAQQRRLLGGYLVASLRSILAFPAEVGGAEGQSLELDVFSRITELLKKSTVS